MWFRMENSTAIARMAPALATGIRGGETGILELSLAPRMEPPAQVFMPMHLSNAWNTATKMINGAIALIPRLTLGLVIFVVFLVIGSIAKSLIRQFTLPVRAWGSCSVAWPRRRSLCWDS
jgi:hypothetical protein